MSNGSEVMIYLSFLLSEFIATRHARLEAREAGFLVPTMYQDNGPVAVHAKAFFSFPYLVQVRTWVLSCRLSDIYYHLEIFNTNTCTHLCDLLTLL